MILKFNGDVKNQRFIPDDPVGFRNSFIEHEGKRVTLSVGRQRKDRSIPQNSYLHGVVFKILSDYSGYEIAEIKGIMKFMFGVKKTSELSTVELMDFVAKIQRWAIKPIEDGGSGWDCYIPDPNGAEMEEIIKTHF